MPEYIDREKLRNVLYEADAILMRGLAIVNQLPAADVVPVRRGLWTTHKTKTGKNWWKCSACDFVSEHKAHHNYCPSCGARMDGEE